MGDSTHRPSRPSCGTKLYMNVDLQVLIVLQIPPTPEHPGPVFQPNIPTYQQNEYPTFQNCYCVQCSAMWRVEHEPPNWYPVERLDPRDSRVSGLL